MTKKTSPSPKSKTKQSSGSKPKSKSVASPKKKAVAAKPQPSAKKVAAAKVKPKPSKAGSKVSPKAKKQPSRPTKPSDEGESKVREIASRSKTASEKTADETESTGFSLADVRSILSTRNTEQKQKKEETEEIKSTGRKSPKGKPKAPSKAKSAKVKKIQTASIDDILGLGASTASSRPIRDEKKVPQEWNGYYNDLMDLRASLKGALGIRSSETLGASARESSGELSLNSSDAGTETFNRDVALSMVASEQEALEEIEDAIDRIFDGTFGVCQETGKPIKKNRLKVVPFTRFSLEGQNLYEKRKRRAGEPVSGAFATISDSTMGEEE